MENQALVLDLLEWISKQPRDYDEVMQAWRTSCPGLPIWEDSVDAGLVQVRTAMGAGKQVEITELGSSLLVANGRGG